jgi:MFS family permease
MLPRAREKRTLATCCATHTLHDGLSDVSYVLLPLLAQSFGLSLAQVGLIRSAHRAAMAVFQIPAGLIAERFGARTLLALGTLVAGRAFLALGWASGFWMIIGALFLAGVGSAVQHTLCSAIVSQAYSRRPRRARHVQLRGRRGKFVRRRRLASRSGGGIAWQATVVGFGVVAEALRSAVFVFVVESARLASMPRRKRSGPVGESTIPAALRRSA